MLITILVFIIILGILVFVHEFGHFIVAKKSGMQVEEFGFGFPPRILGIQKIKGKWKIHGPKNSEIDPSKTVYSINYIPLGGFVKILGENNESEEQPGSFINKGFWPRLLTLVAGVTMNVILAWVLLSVGFMIGLPVGLNSVSDIPAHTIFTNPEMGIVNVLPGQPAEKAGLKTDDVILNIDNQSFTEITGIQNYVKAHEGQPITFEVKRGNQDLKIPVTPTLNPGPDQGPTGIQLALVGKLKFPWYYAIWEGAKTTVIALVQVVSGLFQLFTGKLGLSGVGGPVKIAQLVGVARQSGILALLNLTVMLSLSLAVLNILPFPALDGGRVLFLIIEKVRGKRNNPKVEQIFNTVGFVLLILLMAAVTYKDIFVK